MTIYSVEYANERGAFVRHEYTNADAAIEEFLRRCGLPNHGFPVPESWDLIGYLDETTAHYGYVHSLGPTPETGHQTVCISFSREEN